jgi:hypothetical protein
MSATEVLGEAWGMYKAHWRHLLPIAFVVYLLISLLALLLAVLLGWFGVAVGALIGLAGIFWLQGTLVVAIEDVRDGRADLSIGDTLSRVRPRLNTLAVAGILAAIAIVIGLILIIVPGLLLLTAWLVIVPVIMLEGRRVFESFGRSWELVRPQFGSVFVVMILTVLILIGVGIAFGIIGGILDSRVADVILDIARQTVTAPFVALAWTLTYYRLRGLSRPATSPAGEAAA